MPLKLHLIASALFLLLMFGALAAYNVINPAAEPAAAERAAAERYVQIVRATWGENCQSYVAAQRREKTAKGEKDLPEPIARDNALRAVSSLCNGRDVCNFDVSEAALGFTPIAGCEKVMAIEYRCFLTDRVHTLEVHDDDTALINCTNPAPATTETP